MKTEVTKERLKEFFIPTKGYVRPEDGKIIDYVEVEIIPDGIKKLERKLQRYGSPEDLSKREWMSLHNKKDDTYEHVVAYVYFEEGTDNFVEILLEVVDAYCNEPLNIDELLNEEEKQNIIETAVEYLEKWRNYYGYN